MLPRKNEVGGVFVGITIASSRLRDGMNFMGKTGRVRPSPGRPGIWVMGGWLEGATGFVYALGLRPFFKTLLSQI